MICSEVIAGIFHAKDELSGGSKTFLNIEKLDYQIAQWADDIIVAKHAETGVCKFELRISLKDGIVKRFRTEIRPRPCAICDPEVFEWWMME